MPGSVTSTAGPAIRTGRSSSASRTHTFTRATRRSTRSSSRAKTTALKRENHGLVFDYRVAPTLPLPFPEGAFSHAFVLHPFAAARKPILEELGRIVAPRGQALVAMPLRGSFVEIADLLRECALKHGLESLTTALDAAQLRPTDDIFMRELELVGFEFVEVDVRMRSLKFASGRAFLEDPITRLVLMPEFRHTLGLDRDREDRADPVDPFQYVRDAIDK
jgi:SAM-dependent methyltransferase